MKLITVSKIIALSALLITVSCSNGNSSSFLSSAPPEKLDSARYTYTWNNSFKIENTLVNRIALPDGYKRIQYPDKSFGAWLRHIPLLAGQPEVILYNGEKKRNQNAHVAVLDIDVGTKDLQQCADAVMRLRAEYLLATNQPEKIHFNFTSGDKCAWTDWKRGFTPVINGNSVTWKTSGRPDDSYKNFKAYLEKVFTYAGSLSLSKELKKKKLSDIEAGDVFIHGGSPGHAVIVMDVAKNESGNKIFLLAQSYMPAQQIQVLKNPDNTSLSPWYSVADLSGDFRTPEWTFSVQDLASF